MLQEQINSTSNNIDIVNLYFNGSRLVSSKETLIMMQRLGHKLNKRQQLSHQQIASTCPVVVQIPRHYIHPEGLPVPVFGQLLPLNYNASVYR